MASSIRQVFAFDPAPSNIGGIAGTPSHFRATTSTPTLPGSTIVVIGCIANLAGNTVTGISDSTNGAYTSLDHLTKPSDGLDIGSYYFPNAGIITAGDGGDATGGSTTTCVDSTKAWTTNQWIGATFLNLSNGATSTVTSNTATTLTFGATSATSAGQRYSVGGYVDIQVSNFDDYNAAICVEVIGVTATPLLGHNATQGSYSAGTDNAISGTAALGSAAGIVLGFAIADVNLSSVPATGTGNTSSTVVWKWDQAQFNARLQFRNASNPGTAGSNFSALSTDHYQVFMVALADAGAAVAWPRSTFHPGRSPGRAPESARFYQAPRAYNTLGPSALAGTATLIFGQTGALTGAGALAGSSALVLGQTGALKGAGALAGSSALIFGQTGAVTAAGILAGSSSLVFGQTASLAATGVLAGSSALTFGQTGALTAAGILAGSSALAFGQTATLVGAGTLAGTSALVFGATATADVPSGAISGAAALSFGASGTLTATGALAGSAGLVFAVNGTLDQPSTGIVQPGPVDSPRISEGAFRRKRKKLRRQLEPNEPIFIAPASLEIAPPQAVIDRVPNFQVLAQVSGRTYEQLSRQIDQEIAAIMEREQEADDEEALLMILTALEDD